MRLVVLLSFVAGCSAAGIAEDSETWTAPQHLIDADFRSPTMTAWYGDGDSSWYFPVASFDQFLLGYSSATNSPHGFLSIRFIRNVATTAPITETISACIALIAGDANCRNVDVRYHEDIDQNGRWFAIGVSTPTEVTVRGRFEAN